MRRVDKEKRPDEVVTVVDGVPLPPRKELPQELQETVHDGRGLGHPGDTLPDDALQTWTGDEKGAPRAAEVPAAGDDPSGAYIGTDTGEEQPIESLEAVEEPPADGYSAAATVQDAPRFADDQIEVQQPGAEEPVPLTTLASEDPELAAGGEGIVVDEAKLPDEAEVTLGAYLQPVAEGDAEDLEASCDLPDGPEDPRVRTSLEELTATGESPVAKIGAPAQEIEFPGGEPGSPTDDTTGAFRLDPFGPTPIPPAAEAATVETPTLTETVTVGQTKYNVPEPIQTLNRDGLTGLAEVASAETHLMYEELERLTSVTEIETLNTGLNYYTQLVELVGVDQTVKLSKLIHPTFFRDRANAGDKWIEKNIEELVDVPDTDVPAGYTRSKWLATTFYGRVGKEHSAYLMKNRKETQGPAVDTAAPTATARTTRPSPRREKGSRYRKTTRRKATKPKKGRGCLQTLGCIAIGIVGILFAGGLGYAAYVSDTFSKNQTTSGKPHERVEDIAADDDNTTPKETYVLEAGEGNDFEVATLHPEEPTTPTPEEPTPSFEDNVSELEQLLMSGTNLQISDPNNSRRSWIMYKGGKLTVTRSGHTNAPNYSTLVEAIQGESNLYNTTDSGETTLHYNLIISKSSIVGTALKEGTEIADIVLFIVNTIPSDYSTAEETRDDDDATEETVTTLRYGEGDPDAAADILRIPGETIPTESTVFNGYEPGFDFARRTTQEYKDGISAYARDTFFVPDGKAINYLETDESSVFFRRGAENTTMSAYFYCNGPDGNPKKEKIIFSFTDTESGHKFDYHIFQDGRTREDITDQDGNRTDKRDANTTNQHYAAIFQYFANSGEVLESVPDAAPTPGPVE
jgi:hypothetical protein